MNVESFNLDHRAVSAPYVRLADRKQLPGGDVIVKYDVRFTQPNVAHLEMPTVHSLEHLFAEHSRNHSDAVLDFSPMGCQTGFYLMLQGEPAYDDVLALIDATLRDIIAATEVPAANEVQCGWGANHTLSGAQEAASAFLSARGVWAEVYAKDAPGDASARDAAAR
ncbi:S-ribosylhomocysteine lyase, partial [Promicromonospora kroppenstedtii]|uniref:S-ribosylhomocysteine lyase n=1 Tax=Promicromonospora kroppenstedtii TaxID=440482 RepID=UPI001FE1A3AB